MNSYELHQGDCLEVMKQIPDGSIDMVLCDLPYQCTDFEWDTLVDMDALYSEYKRVCRRNSNVLLFCNIALAHHIMQHSILSEFSHCLVWEKKNKTRFKSASKMPLSQYEMVLVYCMNKYGNKSEHGELRKYFMQELEASGKTVKEIENEIPNRSAHHWFRYSSDYRIPTKQNYERLHKVTGRFSRPYEEVKNEFLRGKKNDRTFNPGIIESDIIRGDLKEAREHPTQKPVELLEKLIRAYSNDGETVLDNCMGAGSTGVACMNTGRNFIGIELDEGYFKAAQNRISEAVSTLE